MLAIPCAVCAAPRFVNELHAWSAGEPLCSAACAQTPPAATMPAPEAALAAARAEIERLAALVREALPAARAAEGSFATAASAQSAEAGLLLGLAGGALAVAAVRGLADAGATSDRDRLAQRLVEIEDGVRRVLRAVMVAEAAGVPSAQHATPLVTHFGTLGGGYASGSVALLEQLHRYLERLHGVLGTVPASDPPPPAESASPRKCPQCYARFDPRTAGYTDFGLVCALCVADAASVDAAQAAGDADLPSAEMVALNAVGLAGLLAVGVGFTASSGAPSKREQEARLDAAARAAERRRRAVFIRRGAREVGPYDLGELLALQDAGHVRTHDEFWIDGMKEWRPMTAFAASLLAR